MNSYKRDYARPDLKIYSRLIRFRDFVYRRFSIFPESKFITLVQKSTKHSEHPSIIENFDSFYLYAKNNSRNFTVNKVTWFHMSIEEQVRLIANTKVLFSLPGSDLMNAVFLPNNAAIIVPERLYGGKWQASNEIRLWFRHRLDLYIDHFRPNATCKGNNSIEINLEDTWSRIQRGAIHEYISPIVRVRLG